MFRAIDKLSADESNQLETENKSNNNNDDKISTALPSENECSARNNAGVMGSLPNEMLEEIVNSVSLKGIKNIRETCCFFWSYPTLKNKINEKSLSIVASSYGTIILRNGCVFILGFHIGSQVSTFLTLTPVCVEGLVVKIVAGDSHILLLDDNNNCFGFGNNCSGQLGSCSKSIPYNEVQQIILPNKEEIIDIAAGGNSTFLRSKSGKWYGLGENYCGQLGIDNTIKFIKTPTLICSPNDKSIIKIISDGRWVFAQDDQGQWYNCGLCCTSFLPQEHKSRVWVNNHKLTPVHLADNQRIVEIKWSHGNVFFLNNNREWLVMGCDKLLSPLVGSNESICSPIHLPPLLGNRSIINIIPYNQRFFYSDNKKQWYVFSATYQDNLGIDRETFNQHKKNNTPMAIQLPNQNTITKFIHSMCHTLVCDDDGNWYGFGKNSNGELGLGKATADIYTPVKIDFDFPDIKYEEKMKASI